MVRVFTTYPPEDASRRLRMDPLVLALRDRGIEVMVHTLLTPELFKDKNRKGWYRLRFGARFAVRLLLRIVDIASVSRSQVVVVHREAFPFFTPLAEKWLAARAGAMVVDVDDALYTRPTHVPDWRRWLRSAGGFDRVLSYADVVFAGSPILRDRAARLGTTALLRHTAPPPDTFALRRVPSAQPTVLWTGSQSTLGGLVPILCDLLEVCEDCEGRIVVLGGPNITSLPHHPRLIAQLWSHRLELSALQSAWVGVMPLTESEWETGKSSYKVLLYLAAGVHAVASAVGMNRTLAGAPELTLVEHETAWKTAVHDAMASFNPARSEVARTWVEARVQPKKELAQAADLIAGLLPKEG